MPNLSHLFLQPLYLQFDFLARDLQFECSLFKCIQETKHAIFVCVCESVCMYVCLYVCVSVCVFLFVCVCVIVCVFNY